MPLSASVLTRLSRSYSRKGHYDVSDSLAIAAACAHRGDFVSREIWIETAIEKMMGHSISVPAVIETSYLRDLAA
jgi:hypothetical protein